MNIVSNLKSSLHSGATVRDAILALVPEIRERADEIEQNQAVPADLLERLEAAGAFRLQLPKIFGGEQLKLSETAEVMEAVAGADASVAWHMMIAAGAQIICSRLPAESQKSFYAHGPDTWSKGALAPKGIAVPVEGGYRLSGRWPLASGARPFEWVNLGFFVKDPDGLRKAPNGMPDFRFCLIPRKGVEVIETWDAVGLRGTRSDDLEVKDIFVPEEWQASLFGPSAIQAPMFGIRMPFPTGPHHSAVVTGLLKAALRDLAIASLTRKPAFNPTTIMKDDPVFRNRFGEISARADSLFALADWCIEKLEEVDSEKRDVTEMEGGKLAAAESLIHHEANVLMDQIMMLSGSGGIYSSNIQQRRWRDLRCAAQHQAANIGNYSNYTKALVENLSNIAN